MKQRFIFVVVNQRTREEVTPHFTRNYERGDSSIEVFIDRVKELILSDIDDMLNTDPMLATALKHDCWYVDYLMVG